MSDSLAILSSGSWPQLVESGIHMMSLVPFIYLVEHDNVHFMVILWPLRPILDYSQTSHKAGMYAWFDLSVIFMLVIYTHKISRYVWGTCIQWIMLECMLDGVRGYGRVVFLIREWADACVCMCANTDDITNKGCVWCHHTFRAKVHLI